VRRLALLGVAAALVLTLPGCGASIPTVPDCGKTDESIFVLEAQSVPSATLLPCFASLPLGWSFSDSTLQNGSSTFWFDSDRAGTMAAEVKLTATCDVSSAVKVPSAEGETPADAYEKPVNLPPSYQDLRFLVFPGGCITERYRFSGNAPATLALEIEQVLSLVPRQKIADGVQATYGLTLCGAGAPPCPG
jgi:hypothetical protein